MSETEKVQVSKIVELLRYVDRYVRAYMTDDLSEEDLIQRLHYYKKHLAEEGYGQ